MSSGRRVLVVDGVSDVQEVLQAILEPRGLKVDWVRGHVPSPHASPLDCPDIVVIDAEASPLSTREDPAWAGVPQVIIGAGGASVAPTTKPAANRRYLDKPFQYIELIQAIEGLLPRRVA